MRDVYRWSVLEDIAVGTVIKAATASDDDSGENARITYSLRPGSRVDLFEIIPDTGSVYFYFTVKFSNIFLYYLWPNSKFQIIVLLFSGMVFISLSFFCSYFSQLMRF